MKPHAGTRSQASLTLGLTNDLFGPHGTGKTYSAMHEKNDGEAFSLCTDDMTAWMSLVGSYLHQTVALTLRVSHPSMRGHRLVVDEIDKAGGDVVALLNMTDSDGSATWQHPVTGEVHKPQRGFKVIMTTNGSN